MKLQTSQKIIEQINDTLEIYTPIYVHGDGNIFVDKEYSQRRIDCCSPSKPESRKVLVFNRGDKVPETSEQLHRMFFDTDYVEQAPVLQTNVPKTIKSKKQAKKTEPEFEIK